MAAYEKGLVEGQDAPPPDRPIPIPDEHYTALGKVADAWADLEFELDQLIWQLLQIPQALGACVTSQMIGLGPRIRALRSLVHLWEVSQHLANKLGKFEGETAPLVDKRNRAIHDKRLINWKTQEVVRFQVTAKGKLVFEQKPESIALLSRLRSDIYAAIDRFATIRNQIRDEIASSDKKRRPLPSIIQAVDRTTVKPLTDPF